MKQFFKKSLLLALSSMLLFPAYIYARTVASPVNHFSADMNRPSSIVSTANAYYILDGANNRVLAFSQQGILRFQFPRIKGHDSRKLLRAMDLKLYKNKFYIADTDHHRIAIYSMSGKFLREISLPLLETSLVKPTELKIRPAEPVALYLDHDTITYSDRANHRICRLNLNKMTHQRCWGKRGEAEGEFQFPFMLSQDKDDYIYAVDVLNSRIQTFNSRGIYFGTVGGFGSAPGDLIRPNGIAIDSQGIIYISDYYQGNISIYDKHKFIGYLQDNKGQTIKFNSPVGLAIRDEILSVLDAGENTLYNYTLLNHSTHNNKQILLENKKNKIKTSNKNCVTCHMSWIKGNRNIFSENESKDAAQVLPSVKPKMCVSCHHGAVVDSRHAITQGHQHPDIHHPLNSDDHKKSEDKIKDVFPLINNKHLYCGSCHTPHENHEKHQALYSDHKNPWLREANQRGQVCHQCHESKVADVQAKQYQTRGKNHPIGIIFSKAPHPKAQHFAGTDTLWQGLPETLKEQGGHSRLNKQGNEELNCQSCHRLHGAIAEPLLLLDNRSGEFCASCHSRETNDSLEQARDKGIHPVNIALEEPLDFNDKEISRIECLTCHSVHEGKKDTPNLVLTHKDGELCENCHSRHTADSLEDAKTKGIHPVNIELEKPLDFNGKQISKIDCLTCHSVHEGKANTPSLVLPHQEGELCEACHEGKANVVDSDHDLRITANNSTNRFEHSPEQSGSCGACHSMHQGNSNQLFLFAGQSPIEEDLIKDKPLSTVRDKLCLDCHQEKMPGEEKVVSLYDHPFQDITLRSDNEKFPLVNAAGERVNQGQIACVSCHNPHQWAPSSKSNKKKNEIKNQEGSVQNSFLSTTDPTEMFCNNCHGKETMLRYQYYHQQLSRQYKSPIK